MLTDAGRAYATAMPTWKAPDDTDLRNIENLKMLGKIIIGPVLIIACLIGLAVLWLS